MAPDARLPGTVLYVEDDDVTRGALGASLERIVESLILAESGAAGLAAFARHSPDLVITDVAMPGMTGLAMAKEIKRTHPHIPVIVTTAYSDTQYLLDAIDLGIDGYVMKPVEFDRVFELVRRGLSVVQHEREAARHRLEEQRLVSELQQALAEVKRLSGIIPVCSYCKSVRDDAGYWASVEQYLTDHSEAQFSHGICPKCLAQHFPEDA